MFKCHPQVFTVDDAWLVLEQAMHLYRRVGKAHMFTPIIQRFGTTVQKTPLAPIVNQIVAASIAFTNTPGDPDEMELDADQATNPKKLP